MEAIEKLKTLRKEAIEREVPWCRFIKKEGKSVFELTEVKDDDGNPIQVPFVNNTVDLSGTPTHALEYLLKKTNDE